MFDHYEYSQTESKKVSKKILAPVLIILVGGALWAADYYKLIKLPYKKAGQVLKSTKQQAIRSRAEASKFIQQAEQSITQLKDKIRTSEATTQVSTYSQKRLNGLKAMLDKLVYNYEQYKTMAADGGQSDADAQEYKRELEEMMEAD